MGLVLDSAEFIVHKAQDVSIPQEGIEKLATILVQEHGRGAFSLANWTKQPLNTKPQEVGEDQALAWIIVVDTLNFCFWHYDPNEYFAVEYNGSTHRGYMSLCALINRAIKEGLPILDPVYLKNMTEEQAKYIFRSDTATEIQQLAKRREVLVELGTVLIEKFDGKWKELIRRADQDASKLVDLVVNNFTSYDDKCFFEGREVYFRKRAQILVADIWACFENDGIGHFNNIDSITMFADYRVPQSLAYFGAIKYSEHLTDTLKTNPYIEPGSRLECEIRAASIWSVELVRRRALELFSSPPTAPFNAVVIDFYLWDYAKASSAKMDHIPIHKPITHFY